MRDVHWCVTVDYQQTANIANQIHGFTIDYSKFILITFIIIHQTHYKKSDWSRAFNQFTIACELDMINAIQCICCRYCIYYVKFNVCLVTKPLGDKMAEHFASVSEDELCEKCIIKQLLNSVFAWYHELSKLCVWVICLSLRLRQITQTLVFDNSWYHAQPHPIIVECIPYNQPKITIISITQLVD